MSRQIPSPRELVAALLAGADSEESDHELGALLVAHSAVLSESVGVTATELTTILRLEQPARGARVRTLIRAAQQQRAAAHQHAMKNLAGAAATMLAGLARFREDHVELDARIVMGSMLADRSIKFIEFAADGYEPVAVARSKLKEAKGALTFPDVRCFIDARGLHFRWHEGRGGLTLWPRDIRREAAERVLKVPIARRLPVTTPTPQTRREERSFWSPKLIGDVLAELSQF